MAEYWIVGTNVIVIILIGWLLRRVGSQDSTFNENMINITKAFAIRPDFTEMDKRIEKAILNPEGKITLLREEFRGHTHEGEDAKVVLSNI
jgi:hypothetical protein